MNARLQDRWLPYAASAQMLLLMHAANGQILVHDPEPNLTGGLNNPVSIDFNDDGINDLEFDIFDIPNFGSNSFGTSTFFNIRKIRAIQEGEGALFCNAPADNNVPFDPHPDILAYDALIGSEGGWYHQDNMVMCSLMMLSTGDIILEKGGWFNLNDTAYVGVKLIILNAVHYGWVRLNVNYLNPSMEITSYGYNLIPGSYIRAGQTDQHSFDLQALQAGTNLLVVPPDVFMGKTINLLVHDISGRTYLNEQVTGQPNIFIPMGDQPSGIYLITLQNDNIRRSIKVMYTRF